MAISALNIFASENGNTEITVLTNEASQAVLHRQAELFPSTPVTPSSVPDSVLSSLAMPAVERPTRNQSGNSLTSLVERFRGESGHLARSTRDKLDFHFTVAARHLNFDRDVASIELKDLRELKSKLSEGQKPSTVNDIIFKALASLFDMALDDGLIERSPIEKLKRARKGEPDRQQPNWEQAQQLAEEVANKSAESGLIVKLMLNFGVGQAEIKFLHGERVDEGKGVIHFRRLTPAL